MHYEWITTESALIRELEENRIRIINCRNYLDALYQFYFNENRRFLSEHDKEELNRCYIWTAAGLKRLCENHKELQRLITEKNGEFIGESIDDIIGDRFSNQLNFRPSSADN